MYMSKFISISPKEFVNSNLDSVYRNNTKQMAYIRKCSFQNYSRYPVKVVLMLKDNNHISIKEYAVEVRAYSDIVLFEGSCCELPPNHSIFIVAGDNIGVEMKLDIIAA